MIAKRLQKELKELKEENLPNIQADPDSKNLCHWTAYLDGPADSYYEGGKFKIDIVFPDKYPFKPPKLNFKTQIYHPNISTNGNICLDILSGKWSPALSITKVLLSLSSLLTDPNPNDPLRSEAARLFDKDIEKYKKKVRQEVKKYAMPKNKDNNDDESEEVDEDVNDDSSSDED